MSNLTPGIFKKSWGCISIAVWLSSHISLQAYGTLSLSIILQNPPVILNKLLKSCRFWTLQTQIHGHQNNLFVHNTVSMVHTCISVCNFWRFVYVFSPISTASLVDEEIRGQIVNHTAVLAVTFWCGFDTDSTHFSSMAFSVFLAIFLQLWSCQPLRQQPTFFVSFYIFAKVSKELYYRTIFFVFLIFFTQFFLHRDQTQPLRCDWKKCHQREL